MGSHEQLCLKWNDFESSIKKGFSNLREKNEFFDVTLASNGQFLKAHKVILSACSPFFHQIIRNIPHDHPFIYLKDIKAQHLESLLCFMYQGEVNVVQEELETFLAVAEELQINGLYQNSGKKFIGPHFKRRIEDNEGLPRKVPRRSKKEAAASNLSHSQEDNPKEGEEILLYDDDEFLEDEEYHEEEEEENSSLGLQTAQGNNISNLKNKCLDKSELDSAIDKLICRSPNGHIYCTQCDYSTALQRSIRDHIEAKHIVTDGFECNQCSLRCKTRASLRRHHYRRHPKASAAS